MAPITKLPKKLRTDDDSLKAEELSSSSMSGSDSNMGSDNKQFARVNRVVLDKNSDEYKKRRERNNLAVKKSRNKSKVRTQQTLERVNQLKAENEMLETKIKILTKELNFLKDLFLAHAGTSHNGQIPDLDMSFLQTTTNGLNDAIQAHEVPDESKMHVTSHIDADDESDTN
ncbi:CCAAT/enhancer-binding protein gamma-like [Oppia nitens]|uniref:CCAAT/enhancer-binding protein gamma-like n=1 Tax=Oppia nitens TaxID=1686743 RepID=UPI0023DBDAF1|nr:CCAAT/enhancer-binding protein gamma-like [Oppia nitens]